MSPAKFVNQDDYDHNRSRKVINGPRPCPLKINKESHSIQKPNNIHHSSTAVPNGGATANKQQKQRQPLIIYTHSPKIIHTQARDFMALVQKLTGLSRSDDNNKNDNANDNNNLRGEEEEAERKKPLKNSSSYKSLSSAGGHEDNESSSVLTDDNNCVNGGGGGGVGYDDVIKPSSSFGRSAAAFSLSNPYFGDIPLFTPNDGAQFFCSPRPVYRFPDATSPPNLAASSLSPSVLEFMKGLQEY